MASNIRTDLPLPPDLEADRPIVVEKLDRALNLIGQIPPGSLAPITPEDNILRAPLDILGQRAKSIGAAKNIDQFFDLVRVALNHKCTNDGITPERRPLFTAEYPPCDLETETITWAIVKRSPASVSQGKAFNQQRQQWKPIIREIIPPGRSSTPGYADIILGQWFENLVDFSCWAQTNKAANARALWFEEFMYQYAWWFQLSGVVNVHFWDRERDQLVETEENKLVRRPLIYFVRTERLYIMSVKTLDDLVIKLHMDSK